jgi:hypothetical protein
MATSSWLSRPGSASASMATILPPLTVKPMTETGGSVALVDSGACRAGWSFEPKPQIAVASSANATASLRSAGSSVAIS